MHAMQHSCPLQTCSIDSQTPLDTPFYLLLLPFKLNGTLKRHVSDRMPAWGLEPIKVLTMHKTQKFVFQIILLNIS